MTKRRPVVEAMDPKMVEILRRTTPGKRMRIAAGMYDSARILIRGAVRREHPDWGEDEVHREIA